MALRRFLFLSCLAAACAVWLRPEEQALEANEQVETDHEAHSMEEMAVVQHFRYQLAMRRDSNSSSKSKVDCELFPRACKAPFKCQEAEQQEKEREKERKAVKKLQGSWDRNHSKLQHKKDDWQHSVEEWEHRRQHRREDREKRMELARKEGKKFEEDPEDLHPEPSPPKNYLEEERAEKPRPKDAKWAWATKDGHANFQEWCTAPKQYLVPALYCQTGHLRMYGKEMHNAQKPFFTTVDSHYCFAFGHCDNHEVEPDTTLEEAEEMCDRRFGHEGWTKLDDLGISPLDVRLDGGPHLSMEALQAFAKMACAMGNYHCDVIYCQQEYCNDPYYRSLWDRVRPLEMRRRNGQKYPPLKSVWEQEANIRGMEQAEEAEG